MNKIILKHSTVSGRIPDSLDVGELAINSEDGAIFFCDSTGKIHRLDAKKVSGFELFTRCALCALALFWLALTVFYLHSHY